MAKQLTKKLAKRTVKKVVKKSLKKSFTKSLALPKDFVFMPRTRALVDQVWGELRNEFNHSPEIAKRALDAAISEMYKADKELAKKAGQAIGKKASNGNRKAASS